MSTWAAIETDGAPSWFTRAEPPYNWFVRLTDSANTWATQLTSSEAAAVIGAINGGGVFPAVTTFRAAWAVNANPRVV